MRTLLLLLLALLPAVPAPGQSAPDVELPPGTRVRVWMQIGGKATGGIQHVSPDTLIVVPEGTAASMRIPRSHIRRLDVSAGRESRSRKALRWGARGFVGGALFWGTLCALDAACTDDGYGDSAVTVGLHMGLGTGAWGAALGAIFPGEEWRRVSPPAQAYVAPAGEGRVAVGVKLRL